MHPPSPSDTRARLLATTERLVYAHGIAATGMDRIVKASGVARKSIYHHFATKEALVAAALAARDERWMAWFEASSAPGLPLPARVQAMFGALAAWFAAPEFRGCAFINAAGETGEAGDDGDAGTLVRQVARAHKMRLLRCLEAIALDAGLAPAAAAELAGQLLILIDGATTVALVTGDAAAAPRAARIAAGLVGN